ncbi:UbiX family flavin prenyltransferase [Roseibium suaedae]|uniref:Flavin prenyltransferase UbiX n=1 Tax=Roseibium suaedae TaxID=735517 RepID=A0A1M7NW89_9HYPH|nr:UbiX family flavin prenyltransferase [Roseibium suaedae]SHN08396.1 4-hydroxy-3-polyprenylbenzoate decarboxylase [Roseibium suaedae]
MTRVILGVSGASGAMLARACAQDLAHRQILFDLVISHAARRTFETECTPCALEEMQKLAARIHEVEDIGAGIASGSHAISGMIVAPCSMRTLAAIAHGFDDNLLTRAASVQLKERRPLVLLAREAPLTLAHLRNMTLVTEMGAIVMPPVPAFYLNPPSLEAAVNQIAARAIDLLRLGPGRAEAWVP